MILKWVALKLKHGIIRANPEAADVSLLALVLVYIPWDIFGISRSNEVASVKRFRYVTFATNDIYLFYHIFSPNQGMLRIIFLRFCSVL